jgi:hypothetical protein
MMNLAKDDRCPGFQCKDNSADSPSRRRIPQPNASSSRDWGTLPQTVRKVPYCIAVNAFAKSCQKESSHCEYARLLSRCTKPASSWSSSRARYPSTILAGKRNATSRSGAIARVANPLGEKAIRWLHKLYSTQGCFSLLTTQRGIAHWLFIYVNWQRSCSIKDSERHI